MNLFNHLPVFIDGFTWVSYHWQTFAAYGLVALAGLYLLARLRKKRPTGCSGSSCKYARKFK